MNATNERILSVSLDLFSEKGYSAVSIRDICKQVQIKESSVYYHFKNKQAIFDELISRFQKYAESMMKKLESVLNEQNNHLGDNFYMSVCDNFFENYLMDEFCNKVIRLLLIEQFHNAEAKKVYDYWIFTKPLNIQSEVFEMLIRMGILCKADGKYLAIKYYAPIFFFAQKWLFSGKLNDETKNGFRTDAYQYIQSFFAEIGGAYNG